jgi:hypothetical protein
MSDRSELIWERRRDGAYFARLSNNGFIEIDAPHSGGYFASVRLRIGGSASLGRLKEMCQAWTDENEPLFSSLPQMR